MPEITLNIHPGADDVVIDGTSMNDVDSFKTECLSNGLVSCDWNTLHTRLISHDVSRFWWFLTESERRSIAEMAIRNTINKLIGYYRKGEDGVWETLAAPCTYNAIIRHLKFGTPNGWDDCYWKYEENSTEVFRYVSAQYYGLPTVHVNIASHVMCGIQVINSISDINNWVIFQYGSSNIKPGDPQLPYGTHVIIQDPFPYPESPQVCIGFDSNVVTEFQI